MMILLCTAALEQCFRVPNNMIKVINVFSLSRVIVPNVTEHEKLNRFLSDNYSLDVLSGKKKDNKLCKLRITQIYAVINENKEIIKYRDNRDKLLGYDKKHVNGILSG